MQFSDLSLIEPLLRAVAEEGYTEPTPVQVQAIPHVLAGRDLLGIAQTGTGKTAAFALPILQRLSAHPPAAGTRRAIRVLVITPTRELAAQIGASFSTYGRHLPVRHAVIFGGVGQRPQEHALQRGVDVLVATPGRLLDLMGQRLVPLDRLEILVVDEADRMLDMGFLPAVRRILAGIPKRRQTLFFSATMGAEPQALADRILSDPARVAVIAQATTVETVTQSVFFVEKHDKQELLEHFLRDAAVSRALVFTRTKHSANRVAQRLCIAGIEAAALHGNKSQSQRERAMRLFRAGGTRVLVATDIAARGIDVDDVSHVVNFDVPNVPESYVHRIGRTARAGAAGNAVSFCGREERSWLASIEREIRMKIPVVADHPWNRARPGAHAPAAAGRYALPHALPPAHAHPARAHAPQPQSAPQRAASVEAAHPRPPAGAAPFHGGWIRPARGPGLRGRRRR